MRKVVLAAVTGILILSGALQMAQAQKSTVRIDITQTKEPISPYIYGQFIEHLGRCIYGGIWAEMLEDRKFYYPVTGEAPAGNVHTWRPVLRRRGTSLRVVTSIPLDDHR